MSEQLEVALSIKSREFDYDVISTNSFTNVLTNLESYDDKFILVDTSIYDLFQNVFSHFPEDRVFKVVADESNKNLFQVEEICAWLMSKNATKTSLLIGVGGGIIQDLSTFVSHIYYRGMKWIYCPTTVLSMSDSCIGAKCALNLAGHKNQLGVIHPPSGIYLVSDFLDTLPDREIKSGLGEILKLSVTGPGEFYSRYKSEALHSDKLVELMLLSLKSKQFIIEEDEYESDLRRILNYGHSFGHALESLSNHEVSHGEAILFGMDLINFLGVRWGITNPDFEADFRATINMVFPEAFFPQGVSAKSLVDELKHDKKMQNGLMVFAVPVDNGNLTLVSKKLNESLIEEVELFMKNGWPLPTS